MIVMMTAITPSVNASSRPLPISRNPTLLDPSLPLSGAGRRSNAGSYPGFGRDNLICRP
jgi:hypothetical protein